MNNPLSKRPFLFLLIAITGGILLQYYTNNTLILRLIALTGGIMSLLSFFVKAERQYNYRWLFGAGVFFLFLSVGGVTTYIKQRSLDYTPNGSIQTYIGYVTDTPQEKPRSIACRIHLDKEDINVVCYLQKDSSKIYPDVGDEVIFVGALQSFKNLGNPNEFDYEKYMYNQGFVASAYLYSSSWKTIGNTKKSLTVLALKFRQKIMDLYHALGFSKDEQTLLAALTLGYQDTLTDDLKQGFRTTGTVHVLSVSGLHVGIIYGMIALLLSFIPRSSKYYKTKPLLVILLLWSYAFIAGLPASVVRASIMLTVFCLAEVFGRKNNSLNSLFIAVFFMLLYNPFELFDIGFQLSCISVLSILVLYPKIVKLIRVKNRIVRAVWNTFVISLVAQLATFPICLYYFGTFPTYFFLANLIIVPLVSFIIYGIGLVLVVWGVATLFPITDYLLSLLVEVVQFLVAILLKAVSILKSLPYALIEDIDFSFVELTLLILAIITLLYAIWRSNSKSLIVSLSLFVSLLGFNLHSTFKSSKKQLIVYNRNGYSELIYSDREGKKSLDSLLAEKNNPVIEIDSIRILIMNNATNLQKYPAEQYKVDYAVVTNGGFYSFLLLERFYEIDTLVLDGSIKSYVRRQLTKECENRGVPLYDVTKNGALSINF